MTPAHLSVVHVASGQLADAFDRPRNQAHVAQVVARKVAPGVARRLAALVTLRRFQGQPVRLDWPRPFEDVLEADLRATVGATSPVIVLAEGCVSLNPRHGRHDRVPARNHSPGVKAWVRGSPLRAHLRNVIVEGVGQPPRKVSANASFSPWRRPLTAYASAGHACSI